MAKIRPLFSFALLGSLIIALSGCTSIMRMKIETDPKTNAGAPFTVVVQRADPNALPSNDYREISESIFKNSADSSIVQQAVILPGQSTFLEITAPEEELLVVYFLFTDPGPRWYFPFQHPLPGEVVIELKGHEIERVSADER
jgi:predicted component of type VI protein secretion system